MPSRHNNKDKMEFKITFSTSKAKTRNQKSEISTQKKRERGKSVLNYKLLDLKCCTTVKTKQNGGMMKYVDKSPFLKSFRQSQSTWQSPKQMAKV